MTCSCYLALFWFASPCLALPCLANPLMIRDAVALAENSRLCWTPGSILYTLVEERTSIEICFFRGGKFHNSDKTNLDICYRSSTADYLLQIIYSTVVPHPPFPENVLLDLHSTDLTLPTQETCATAVDHARLYGSHRAT